MSLIITFKIKNYNQILHEYFLSHACCWICHRMTGFLRNKFTLWNTKKDSILKFRPYQRNFWNWIWRTEFVPFRLKGFLQLLINQKFNFTVLKRYFWRWNRLILFFFSRGNKKRTITTDMCSVMVTESAAYIIQGTLSGKSEAHNSGLEWLDIILITAKTGIG